MLLPLSTGTFINYISIFIDMIPARDLFRALGVETNHRILRVLLRDERCACELPALIGKTQSNTSMHLAKLLALGIVASRRDGKKVIYRLADARVKRLYAVAS